MYTRKLKDMSGMVVPVLICVNSKHVLRVLENSAWYHKRQKMVSAVINKQSFKEDVTSGLEVGA